MTATSKSWVALEMRRDSIVQGNSFQVLVLTILARSPLLAKRISLCLEKETLVMKSLLGPFLLLAQIKIPWTLALESKTISCIPIKMKKSSWANLHLDQVDTTKTFTLRASASQRKGSQFLRYFHFLANRIRVHEGSGYKTGILRQRFQFSTLWTLAGTLKCYYKVQK